MRKIFIILFFALQINAQSVDFPADMVGKYAQPESATFGNIRTILTSSYRNGNLLGDIIVEIFDSNQRRIEKITHSADIEIHSEKMVNLSFKTYYFYQDVGNKLSEIRSFKHDGSFTAKSIFSYDTKGRLQEELVYPKNNKLTDKVTYSYNEEKKEIIVISIGYYENHTVTDKTVLQYNEKNQWTKRIAYDKFGNIKDIVTFEYDKNDFLVKETTCCRYNFFHTYEYKFDKKGNWIERVEFYSQKDKEGKWVASESLRTYRVITYYNEELK